MKTTPISKPKDHGATEFDKQCHRVFGAQSNGVKYIERDLLYEQLNSMGQEFDLIDALEIIENFPSADVVPVVRCRDCKYRTQETRWTRAGFCGRRGAGEFFVAKPDGFCSYGERKEDVPNG